MSAPHIQIGDRRLTLDALPANVIWRFDTDNHLTLALPDSAEVYDFHAQPGVRPLLRTVNAVLLVRPDRNAPFEFRLPATWNLTDDHKFEVTIGETTSTIDGYLYDSLGRFRYHFFDKTNLMNETVLGFRGEWVNASAPGTVRFVYDIETSGQKGSFTLTHPLAVDPAANQLAYTYDKDGHTFKLQFAGSFAYRNLELSYAVERSQETDGKPTTLRFGAVLESKNASGTLYFVLTDQNGSVTTQTLSLTGGFVSQFRNGHLELGFRFQQARTNGVAANTLLLDGTLTQQKGAFAWKIETNGITTTLGISLQQIQLGEARAQTGLNVVLDNNRLAGVRGLFGISL